MKIAYIILAHDQPAQLTKLIALILKDEPDDCVFLHWDKRSHFDISDYLRDNLPPDILSRTFFHSTVKVKWGMWSIVEATLSCISHLLNCGRSFDYVILMSGHDYPIKPIPTLKDFLSAHNGTEFIECVDADERQWVIGGIYKERYLYRHYVSYRTPTIQFRLLLWLQKKLGLKRKFPKGLSPHFGSQWWALTIETIKSIDSLSKQPAIRNFFKLTCIPDELFVQTLVARLVPRDKIYGSNLTFYKFTPSGKPYVFYNDHFEFLTNQDYFFARKISPDALLLRAKLDVYLTQKTAAPEELCKNLAEIEAHEKTELFANHESRIIAYADGDLGDLIHIKKDYVVFVCDTYDTSIAIDKIIPELGYTAAHIGIKPSVSIPAFHLGNGLFPKKFPELFGHDLANYAYYLSKISLNSPLCFIVHKDHHVANLFAHHTKALIVNVQTKLEFSDKGKLCYLFFITGGAGGNYDLRELVKASSQPIDVNDSRSIAELFGAVISRLKVLSRLYEQLP